MHIIRLNGEMFRRFRQNKADYLKHVEAVFCGNSVQLRKPDGGVLTIRSRGEGTERSMPGLPRVQKARMMLCRVDDGIPVREATPAEIELGQRSRPNRRPEDPIVGKITASDGKAYYIRVITPDDMEKFRRKLEASKPEPVSGEPMQDEVIEEGDVSAPPIDMEGAEGTVGPGPTREERREQLQRQLSELDEEQS